MHGNSSLLDAVWTKSADELGRQMNENKAVSVAVSPSRVLSIEIAICALSGLFAREFETRPF